MTNENQTKKFFIYARKSTDSEDRQIRSIADQLADNPAKTVKRLREKMGISQEKLARLADVSNNTIINIEAGKQGNLTIETLKKIAKALNAPIEDLIK